MRVFRQTLMLLMLGLSGASRIVGALATIILSTACAVGILVSMLSMGTGLRAGANSNVRDDRVVIRSETARGNFMSSLTREAASSIQDAPGIRSGPLGERLAAVSVLAIVEGESVKDSSKASLTLLGVGSTYMAVYPELRVTAGRMFRSGLHEVIVGRSYVGKFSGLGIGSKFSSRGVEWTIVGHFEAGGGPSEAAVLADSEAVMSAFHIPHFNVVTALLQNTNSLAQLRDALRADPTLRVVVKREAEVVAEDTRATGGILDFVSYFVITFMTLGAALAAINAMFAVIDERRRETATLRAFGFQNLPILVALVIETVLITVPGAVLGGLSAWCLVDGVKANLMNQGILLLVTTHLLIQGIVCGVLVGVIGGLLPALRILRSSVVKDLAEA